MNGYLGETPVDVATHPLYSKYTSSDWALLFIGRYGQYDGQHHSLWVLDQVARILKGTPVQVTCARWDNGQSEYRFTLGEPSAQYITWRVEMRGEGNDEEGFEYHYDEGTPP